MSYRVIAFAAVLALGAAIVGTASGQSSSSPAGADPTAAGKAVYKRANCVGCHKWHGNGGGGYGGDALSLRQTQLTREQIIMTVTCGRPSTGMPFHVRGAYDTVDCYSMKRADLVGMMPPEATIFLRPKEIEEVADYVIAHIKGHGEPDFADCIAFFGEGSRVCNIYLKDKPAGSGTSG